MQTTQYKYHYSLSTNPCLRGDGLGVSTAETQPPNHYRGGGSLDPNSVLEATKFLVNFGYFLPKPLGSGPRHPFLVLRHERIRLMTRGVRSLNSG